jgi:hypothetical protein
VTEQCGVCSEFVEDITRNNIIFYEDQPFHRECFKEKAEDEMPPEPAEEVKELVDDPALTRFEKDGNLLVPWKRSGDSKRNPTEGGSTD